MQKRIDEIWERFCVIYPKLRKFKQPEVKMNKRLKTTAGRCFYYENYIDLSQSLFDKFTEDFYNDTIPHEMAHQVTFNLYGPEATAHGPEWKSVMIAYGIKPQRCHDYMTR